MNAEIYDRLEQLPTNLLESCRKMAMPSTLLMCAPDYFALLDVKNPHMEGNVGNLDSAKARHQWQELREAFIGTDAAVELIDPLEDCEDMVFCANQTFVGTDASGAKLCILSNMKHESRKREVAAFEKWFSRRAYRVERLPENIVFEGSGDAIWHPGRGLIWGGSGYRSQAEVYPYLSESFAVPVIRLALKSDRFYHLDTCFAAIDEETVLLNPRAIFDEGLEMVRSIFRNVIECDDDESAKLMACNATAIGGKHVVIQRGCAKTVSTLENLGYTVCEVDTSEFLKSGGSVFCMKMYVF
ncbi:MAG: hypothetical protein K2X81_04185 [Candidatus Obscuribacterales bacterium]|nr:hypothetical protein [Candidatus Obscuribacterales bacterium]